MSKDCLFFNVFVPSTRKPDEKMAVMVWIHGGGFAYGTSVWYPGGILAAFNDFIVVSVPIVLGYWASLKFLKLMSKEAMGF